MVTVGLAVSTVNADTASVFDTLPAMSVTIIIQLMCAPSASVLKVMVLLLDVAEVVALEQSPP